MYFIQQSEAADTGEEGGWDTEDPVVDLPEEPAGSVSVFSLIGPDGLVVSAVDFPDLEDPAVLTEIEEKLPAKYAFSSRETREKLIRSKFSSANVPALWFENGTWQGGDVSKSEFTNNGPNTTAGSNSIKNVVYYSYRGVNPFFAPDNRYNRASYNDKGNRKMDRFVFYRFTGDTAAPSLDNMLVAVDSYTRLFFAFGKPTAYKTVFGQKVPTAWGPVESTSTDDQGKSRPFYEYDPAGYIDETGKFINASWYDTNMAAGNYDPRYTGLSPYSVKTGSLTGFTPVITASSVSTEGILQGSDGRYYTKIKVTPQPQPATYHLYRLDDRGAEWLTVGNPAKAASGEALEFRDYNALLLAKLPRYKVEAYSDTGDLFGTSEEMEGSRMLTSREALLAAMETIRLSFTQLWYTEAIPFVFRNDSINGLTGRYDHGIKLINFPRFQAYTDFSNSLVTINGTFMKDNGGGAIGLDKKGLWTQNSSKWPSSPFPARTDSLTISYEGQQWDIIFNEIDITNNDGNAPAWSTGSFTVRKGTEELLYGKSEVPFALFMSEATYRSSLGGADYTQQ